VKHSNGKTSSDATTYVPRHAAPLTVRPITQDITDEDGWAFE
jgi:hypothetical protein